MPSAYLQRRVHSGERVMARGSLVCFLYPATHNSSGVLWFHVGRPLVRPSVRPSVRFLFPDDNFSKHQWIFTKLAMCIDIVEMWFGIANGQISSIFDNFSKHQWIFTKLAMCIDIVEM